MTDAWLITACGYEPCRITGATRCRTRSGEPEIKIRVRGQRRHQWVHPFLVRNSADDARQLYTSAQQIAAFGHLDICDAAIRVVEHRLISTGH